MSKSTKMLHEDRRVKAEQLSLNVIIIAVLGLLVLAVIAFIFLRRTGAFEEAIRTCDGVCIAENENCPEANPIKIRMLNCVDGITKGGKICCVNI
jgi:hypothetical protein